MDQKMPVWMGFITPCEAFAIIGYLNADLIEYD
jgi:hypothetical protein